MEHPEARDSLSLEDGIAEIPRRARLSGLMRHGAFGDAAGLAQLSMQPQTSSAATEGLGSCSFEPPLWQ